MERRTYVIACCIIFGLLLSLSGYLFHLHTVGAWAHDLKVSLERETAEMEASNRRLQTKILYSGFTSNRQIAGVLNANELLDVWMRFNLSASRIDTLSTNSLHKVIMSAAETKTLDLRATQKSFSTDSNFARYVPTSFGDIAQRNVFNIFFLLSLVLVWHYTTNPPLYRVRVHSNVIPIDKNQQFNSSGYSWALSAIFFILLVNFLCQ